MLDCVISKTLFGLVLTFCVDYHSAGACGINLTAANRVFILEPCFNQSLEQQAIGRVWRLGQKRPVKIIRMIMKNSVEERMQIMLQKKYGGASAPKSSNDGEQVDHKGTVLGSLQTDKADIVADEFDLLFGINRKSL